VEQRKQRMEQRKQRRNGGLLAAAGAAVFAIASLGQVAAQVAGGLSIPVVGGGLQGTAVLRITQFTLQDERTAVAIGTLSASTTGSNGHRTVVAQVAMPVVSVTSATVTTGGVDLGAEGGGGAFGVAGTTGGTGGGGTAFAPGAAAPGQVAVCGPLRVVLGPMTIARQGLTLNVQRLDIDIDAGLEATTVSAVSQAASRLNTAVCSVDAALAAQRQGAGILGGTGVTGTTGTTGATAGTTAGTTATIGGGMTVGAATGQPTPLQNLVAALNEVLGAV